MYGFAIKYLRRELFTLSDYLTDVRTIQLNKLLGMAGKTMIDFHKKNPSVKQREECFINGIREYKHNLFRIAKSILHHDAEAEDAVSETICKAYSRLDSLRSLESFKPWVMKILINECYAAAKRRSRIEYWPQVENACLEDRNIAIQAGVEDSRGSGSELRAAVSLLDQEFRTVVILFYYEDLSIKDISKVLSLPQGTVKSRLARAKQKLKVLLEIEKGFEGKGEMNDGSF